MKLRFSMCPRAVRVDGMCSTDAKTVQMGFAGGAVQCRQVLLEQLEWAHYWWHSLLLDCTTHGTHSSCSGACAVYGVPSSWSGTMPHMVPSPATLGPALHVVPVDTTYILGPRLAGADTLPGVHPGMAEWVLCAVHILGLALR